MLKYVHRRTRASIFLSGGMGTIALPEFRKYPKAIVMIYIQMQVLYFKSIG